MFRIGIVGSDSSHAEVFAKLINLPDKNTEELLFPDCKVTAIFGLDKERTEDVAKKGKISFIAERVEELYSIVDAVMIVFRHGNLHKEYALPFIERGIATWVDKPFTILKEDALEIIKVAEGKKCLLTGGSTCKFAPEIIEAREERLKGDNIGALKEGFISFMGDFENPNGGVYFYGAHLVEMALEVFGHEVIDTFSFRTKSALTSVLTYADYEVTLRFTESFVETPILLLGNKGTHYSKVDMSRVYKHGLDNFVNMLRSRELPYSLEKLYSSVEIFNRIVDGIIEI